MQVTSVITRQEFKIALGAARAVNAPASAAGLTAGRDAGLWGSVSEVWDRIESALDSAYLFGKDAAVQKIDAALDAVDRLMDSVGRRAGEAQEWLLARVQAYLSTIIDIAVRHTRSTVTVGESVLVLEGVELAQKISLTGSLKAAISEICNLSANGEIAIIARYAFP